MNEREKRIKMFLIEKGLYQSQVAKRLGVGSPFLSLWIKGVRRSARVRRYFIEDLGCPESIVDAEPAGNGR